MSLRRPLLGCLVLSTLAFACDDEEGESTSPPPPPDGGVVYLFDAGPPDGEPPNFTDRDARLPDADLPDVILPDADVPDGASDADLPDAELPDAEMVDGDVPDEGMGDGGMADMELADMELADMDPPDVGPEGLIGQVNFEVLQADALFDWAEVAAHGVFVPEIAALDLEHVAGWYDYVYGVQTFIVHGYWPTPGEGEILAADPERLEEGAALEGLDIGQFLALGELLVAPYDPVATEASGVPIYASLLEDGEGIYEQLEIGQRLPLEIDGGEDLGPLSIPDVVVVPDAIELTSHDQSLPMPIRYGEPLTISWTPSPEPDDYVIVSVLTFEDDEGFVLRVDDAVGEVTLDAALTDFGISLGTAPTLSVSRTRRHQVAVTEAAEVRVVETTRVFLYGRQVKPAELSPAQLPVGQRTRVRISWWDGTFDPEAPGFSVSLGDGVVLENVQLADTQGHVLSAEAVIAEDAPTGPIHLQVSDGEESVFRSGRLGFVTTALPSAGDCQSALDEGPVSDGTYVATYTGLEPVGFLGELTCRFGNPEAGEQVIPVSLVAGQTLTAELVTGAFGTLYIADRCEMGALPFGCVFREAIEAPVVLRYTAEFDETVLLVVDAYSVEGSQPEGNDAPYLVDIRRSEPVPLVPLPDAVISEDEEVIEVLSIGAGFDVETANFDLGPDMEIVSVDVPGGAGDFLAEVTVRAADVSVPTRVPITATLVDGTRVTAEEAVEIIPYYGTVPSCEIANFIDPWTVNGTYAGSTEFGDRELDPPVVCPNGASGPETVYPVALGPGETLRARANMPDGDAVLYVIGGCDGLPLVCSDIGAVGNNEYVEWTGPAEPSLVYLVVDGFDIGDFGFITVELEVGP
ncbi:MAG: hypothetical protein ACE366_12710 [Bradymonadia bacterium]